MFVDYAGTTLACAGATRAVIDASTGGSSEAMTAQLFVGIWGGVGAYAVA